MRLGRKLPQPPTAVQDDLREDTLSVYLDGALAWYNVGCSVIPIRPDTSKRPMVEWGEYQTNRPSEGTVRNWWHYTSTAGIAVICGAVSGNLEMTEFEGRAADADSFDKVYAVADRLGSRDLIDMLLTQGYAEWTPSGGIHLLYRIADHPVPGNTKIANDADNLCLAETRGEGGYVIVAPTGGHCHSTGEPWQAFSGLSDDGQTLNILTITWAQRCLLHQTIAEALDAPKAPLPPREPRKPPQLPSDGLRPGDDYNARTDWADILEPEGWTVASRRGDEIHWTRPGKNPRDGASATTGREDSDNLYVFSTSTGLPTEQPLSKFFVYAHYRHGGDLAQAASQLRADGYGASTPVIIPDAWNYTRSFPEQVSPLPPQILEQVVPAGLIGQTPPPPPPPDLVWETHTDLGNGKRMGKMFGETWRYVPERKRWMGWDGRLWRTDLSADRVTYAAGLMAEEVARQAKALGEEGEELAKWAKTSMSDTKLKAAVSQFRAQPGINASVDEFDQEADLLNVGNGILNLRTGEFMEHHPKFMLSKMFGASYNPAATAPRFVQFMEEILPDPELRRFVQRMAGYSLLGKPDRRAMAILSGSGRNGKSKFIECLVRLFGDYGGTAASSTFRAKRDGSPTIDLHGLRGKRFVATSEASENSQMDDELVKRITGLDQVTTRGHHEEFQSWTPQCVVWVGTNYFPKTNPEDNAIFDRLKVVQFEQTFDEQTADPAILDKLLAEADGILNWLLEGLAMFQAQGLAMPQKVVDAGAAYRLEQDNVAQFMTAAVEEEIVVVAADEAIPSNQLYHMYEQWCAENSHIRVGQVKFTKRMTALGYQKVKRSSMVWLGLKQGERGVLGTISPWLTNSRR